MKKLTWVIIGAAAILYYFYGHWDNDFVVPQQALSERNGSGISRVEFMSLFNDKKAFSQLTNENYYTVVEVYLDTCPICKRLETGYDSFLKKRKDVLIKKVHFPESGINFTISSQQEADDLQARIKSYSVCGTPHVEIYGPDKNLISADNCGSKQGTNFLRHWISAETGIPRYLL